MHAGKLQQQQQQRFLPIVSAKSKSVFRILTREDAEDESLLSYLSFIRPISFISVSHSNNQSESTTKFYNSSKAEIGGTR